MTQDNELPYRHHSRDAWREAVVGGYLSRAEQRSGHGARSGNDAAVRITERFAVAYANTGGGDLAGPELLPVRLAKACTRVLPVAGAGISMFGTSGLRIPVGASGDRAAIAERLQFTAGEGPCLDAHALSRSVLATESLMAQRWPEFYSGLVARTPFRAITAIPLPLGLKGAGTVDLLFNSSADMAELDIVDADAVLGEVDRILRTESVVEFSLLGPGPAWLSSPSAGSRNTVFVALGFLNIALEVSTQDALALLRARAYAAGRTVDDIARDIVDRRMPVDALRVDTNN